MDKSWITCKRSSDSYLKGVEEFISFGFDNAAQDNKILCPCKECNNSRWLKRDEILEHLLFKGFDPSYTHWSCHGERYLNLNGGGIAHNDKVSVDDINGLIQDSYPVMQGHSRDDDLADNEEDNNEDNLEDNEKISYSTKELYNLLQSGKQELYPGCAEFTKLSFVIRLYLMKCLNGWRNSSFTQLLGLLKRSFPKGEVLPEDLNETKTMLKGFGFGYNKIDACPNHCMLFWKEDEAADFCRICGACRWITFEKDVQRQCKTNRNISQNDLKALLPNGNKIPKKILRHFPLIPRLQRLFMCSKTSSSMRWHEEERTKDGKLRHPADAEAWKYFDSKHIEFSSDPRNVRLGLATDGFNPFGNMSLSYSIWPVILFPYNLPPWMCMKSSYLMLSLLIPGDKSPGANIDVYLQPLVEELKELWHKGVPTFDVASHQIFNMRAALLWNVHDFPAYAMVSGWSTKGKLACPFCNYDTCSLYLPNSKKLCYMGHRRFLDRDHEWREDIQPFQGEERRPAPSSLSGCDILSIVLELRTGKRKRDGKLIPWTKKSILFDLPYWKTNILRHNLDVMHIEKNVCDNVLSTLLDIAGKSKDHLNARLDLQELGIRPDLHPQKFGDDKVLLPPASFTLGRKEKESFCKLIKEVRIADGCASNISRCVQLKDRKISGLKSHDSHFLLQHLLQIAVKRTLPKHVAETLIRLGTFFRRLCAKTLDLNELDALQAEIAEILCQLETIFPPSFFDIMVHLPIHLIEEAKLGGPVYYRWMYPIERFLHRLKSYVRNRSRPEGSIAEAYIAEECSTFCSRYLSESADTRFNRTTRNCDDSYNDSINCSLLPSSGRPIGNREVFTLDDDDWSKAHRYVLFNCDALHPYLQEHRDILESQRSRGRSAKWARAHDHSQTFYEWFEKRVRNDDVSEDIKRLSRGPDVLANRFNGFLINGYRFRIKKRDAGKKTQNSGVMVVSSTPSFSSSKDQNPVVGDVHYYGVVNDIFELDYSGHLKVVLFKCEWFEVKEDEFKLPLVNFRKLIYQNDPYVFASQVQQVFYVQDPCDSNWHNAVKVTPRDSYDMGEESFTDDGGMQL